MTAGPHAGASSLCLSPRVFRSFAGPRALALLGVEGVCRRGVCDARPPAGRVPEIFGGRRRKGGALGLPHETLDVDERVIDADHVEGVGFTPAARRRRRAGGDNERTMSGDLVPLGRVPRMTDV